MPSEAATAAAAMLAGVAVIYAGGLGWLAALHVGDVSLAIAAGAAPFFIADVSKAILAAAAWKMGTGLLFARPTGEK